MNPFPVNTLSHELTANVPNSIGGNPPFCSLASFLVVSLTRLIINPDS